MTANLYAIGKNREANKRRRIIYEKCTSMVDWYPDTNYYYLQFVLLESIKLTTQSVAPYA